MASKSGRRWQNVKQHWAAIGVVGIGLVVVIVLILFGYRLDWTGFNGNIKSGKTLWDWLQLLIIPSVLTFGVWWLTRLQQQRDRQFAEQRAQTERDIALDNQREATLQTYFDKMSELLIHEKLRQSQSDDEVRRIATLQTLTALPRLDGKRKGSVLLFLDEAGLIETANPIIMFGAAGLHAADLRGCDVSGIAGVSLSDSYISYAILDEANFTGVHLRGIVFEGGSLRKARLIGADLRDSHFFGTNLSEADLTGADLTDASLVAVNLTEAVVTDEQLDKTKLLQGATMPNGSIHS